MQKTKDDHPSFKFSLSFSNSCSDGERFIVGSKGKLTSQIFVGVLKFLYIYNLFGLTFREDFFIAINYLSFSTSKFSEWPNLKLIQASSI